MTAANPALIGTASAHRRTGVCAIAQQAQESIRRVANQLRVVVPGGGHLITGYPENSICPYSFQIPNLE
jgi:hypothetical protein